MSVDLDPHSLFRRNVGDLLAAGMRLSPGQMRLLMEPDHDDHALTVWVPPDPEHWRRGCCQYPCVEPTGELTPDGRVIGTKVRLPTVIDVDWRFPIINEIGEVMWDDESAWSLPSVVGWFETPLEDYYLGEARADFARIWACEPITAEQASVFEAATRSAFNESGWELADEINMLFEYAAPGASFEETIKAAGLSFPEAEELRFYFETKSVPEPEFHLQLDGEEKVLWDRLLRTGPRNQAIAERLLTNQDQYDDLRFEMENSPWV